MKNEYIHAVQWMYGMTKKEALAYIQSASTETLKAIQNAFSNNTKRAFYND